MDLALDTSTPRLSMTGGSRTFQATVMAPQPRLGNRYLANALVRICRRVHCRPGEFDRLWVTVGPGSFTGTRIGIAFVLGLACRRPARIYPVNTLLAMALGWEEEGPVLPVLPAGKGLWYAAVFERRRKILEIHSPAVADAAGVERLARNARPLSLAPDPALPVPAAVMTRPLSRILFDHRDLCTKSDKTPRPLYLKSLYD